MVIRLDPEPQLATRASRSGAEAGGTVGETNSEPGVVAGGLDYIDDALLDAAEVDAEVRGLVRSRHRQRTLGAADDSVHVLGAASEADISSLVEEADINGDGVMDIILADGNLRI